MASRVRRRAVLDARPAPRDRACVVFWALAALAVMARSRCWPGLIDLRPQPRRAAIARDFLLFVIALPALAVFAFAFDGVYIGATWARVCAI